MGGGHNRQQRGRSAPKREKQTPRRSSPLRVNLLVYAVTLLLCIAQGHTTAAGARQRAPVRPAAVRTAQAKARTVHPKAAPMATKWQLVTIGCAPARNYYTMRRRIRRKMRQGHTNAAIVQPSIHSGRPATPPPATAMWRSSKALLPPRIISIEKKDNH